MTNYLFITFSFCFLFIASPVVAETNSCNQGRTPYLCNLPSSVNSLDCPVWDINRPEYQRISCYHQGDVKYAVYALKESNIYEFSPVTVTDFDYGYIFMAESQNPEAILNAAGFSKSNNNKLTFITTQLAPLMNHESIIKRNVVKNLQRENNWHIGNEHINYMGPGDGIDFDCLTAIQLGASQKKSFAIMSCIFAYDTDIQQKFNLMLKNFHYKP